jgi:probable HAF family extracellular repeat protein
MAFNSIRLAGVAIAATIGIASAQSAQAASFMSLGYLPGGSASLYPDSRASGISADGLVVVGSSSSSNGTEAFRWTQAGGMVGLGSLPGTSFNSNASAVSADGSVVVGYSNGVNGREPFRWTQSGGMVGLGNLSGGASAGRSLNDMGVSADGSVVVGQSAGANGPEAFRWTQASGMVGLGDLPGGRFASGASGVSADGSVVVGYANANGPEQPFRWTEAGGMVGLSSPSAGGGFGSYANAVSADGSVVVGDSGLNGFEAFRWTQTDGMVGLGFLPGGGYFSTAQAASADGSVVVGQSPTGNFTVEPYTAFIWTEPQGMLSIKNLLTASGLDLTGWRLQRATGVSANGRTITGYGQNPNGNYEAWIAQLDDPTPIPEPTSVVVLGLIGMGLGSSCKRGGIGA